LLRYGHLKFVKMAASCHLGFDLTGNVVVRSAIRKNTILERNMKWIGWRTADLWPFEIFHSVWMGPSVSQSSFSIFRT